MKIYYLLVLCLCAGFVFTVSADEFTNTDLSAQGFANTNNSSTASDLAQQAKAQLQEASSPQDFQAAAALLEKSIALNPGDLDVRQTLGWVYLDQLHEPQKAYPHLKILAQGHPNDVNARKLFGLACFQTGRENKAVEEFRAASQLQPNDLWIRAYLGRSLARTGRLGHAKDIFDQILKMDPNNSDARLGEAEVYAWSGHSGEALPILDQLIKENPDNTEALELRADIRRWSWNLSGAEQDYQQVLNDNTNESDAMTGLKQTVNTMYLPQIMERIRQTAPAGADMSWKY
jgi:tetratricopeptide (TPR) repeat protein